MKILNVPLCWYENFCTENSTAVHVHALFNGAHVAIMFPCDNHNLFNETYVIMVIIIPNKNTSYGRCAYTSAVSPK